MQSKWSAVAGRDDSSNQSAAAACCVKFRRHAAAPWDQRDAFVRFDEQTTSCQDDVYREADPLPHQMAQAVWKPKPRSSKHGIRKTRTTISKHCTDEWEFAMSTAVHFIYPQQPLISD